MTAGGDLDKLGRGTIGHRPRNSTPWPLIRIRSFGALVPTDGSVAIRHFRVRCDSHYCIVHPSRRSEQLNPRSLLTEDAAPCFRYLSVA